MQTFKHIVNLADEGSRLDQWFKRHKIPINYTSIQKLIRLGHIRINGKRVKANAILKQNDEVRYQITDLNLQLAPQSAPEVQVKFHHRKAFQESILFEDEHYIAINKPQGLAVQGGTGTKIHLDAIVKSLWPDTSIRPKITHRLDKDTSGVLVFAKSLESARVLCQHFAEHRVTKIYSALVVGTLPNLAGQINASIEKLGGPQKEKMTVSNRGLGASTQYKTLRTSQRSNLSLVEFQPMTGRTHQIRVHAAHLECPILGDGKYGGVRAHSLQVRTNLCLHASQLSFKGPGGKNYHFQAPLPQSFNDILQAEF